MARKTKLSDVTNLKSAGDGMVVIPASELDAVVKKYRGAGQIAMRILRDNIRAAYKPSETVAYKRTRNLINAPYKIKMSESIEQVGSVVNITITCSLGDEIYHPSWFGATKGQPVNTLALLDKGYTWRTPPEDGHIEWFTTRKAGHITEKTQEQFAEYAQSIGLNAALTIEYD